MERGTSAYEDAFNEQPSAHTKKIMSTKTIDAMAGHAETICQITAAIGIGKTTKLNPTDKDFGDQNSHSRYISSCYVRQ